MADIVPARTIIKTEDVQFRSSISQAVGNKMGATMNFISNYQYDAKAWFFNGTYSIKGNSQIGVDGGYVCMSNMYIYALSMYNLVKGTSGIFQIDIKRHTSTGTVGSSIFTVKPSISYLDGDNAYLAYRFSDSQVIQQPANSVLPSLLSPNLNAGDLLTCDITSTQFDAQNAGIVLYMRPR